MIGNIRIFLAEYLDLGSRITIGTDIPGDITREFWVFFILPDTVYEDIDSLFMNQSGCEEDFYHWYYFVYG
jgi:hypothetical protein